jgi:hypothetical protein
MYYESILVKNSKFETREYFVFVILFIFVIF